MARTGASVADVYASRAGATDADVVAGAVVAVVAVVAGVAGVSGSPQSHSVEAQSVFLGVRSMPSFASKAFVTGTVKVNHSSSDVLASGHWLKCHDPRLRALRSSDHPSHSVAVPASIWSMLVNSSSSMRSSFIADDVLARELADANVYAFLPTRE